MIFTNPGDPRVRETLAKAEAEGQGLRLAGAGSVLEGQGFSAAQASAVTGESNARLTVGEEADAEPLIERRKGWFG